MAPDVIRRRLRHWRRTVLRETGFGSELRGGFVQSRFQLSNLRLRGFIPAPELADVVGQASISDFQPNFVQPYPDVFQTVAGGQQIPDIRPCLPDLARLGARLFPHACA